MTTNKEVYTSDDGNVDSMIDIPPKVGFSGKTSLFEEVK